MSESETSTTGTTGTTGTIGATGATSRGTTTSRRTTTSPSGATSPPARLGRRSASAVIGSPGWRIASAAAALALATMSLGVARTPALAAEAESEQAPSAAAKGAPGFVAGEAIELEATVEAIDQKTRSVTLKAETGRVLTVTAGPEVRNFDQIEVGDTVRVDYIEALALYVEKAGGSPMAEVGAAMERARPGEKPAVAVAGTVEIKAEVTAIDEEKRTVTLKGPQGNERTIKVGPEVKRFDELSVGDDVVARYTEAIAIAVEKP